MNHKEKIESLLATQDYINNTQAFQLIKDQLRFDSKDAILYILKYQIKHFWDIATKEWIFKINETQFKCYIYEMQDGYFMENRVDICCEILNGDKKIEEQKELGDFGYNIGSRKLNKHAPTLGNFKEVAIDLFSTTLDHWLNENQV